MQNTLRLEAIKLAVQAEAARQIPDHEKLLALGEKIYKFLTKDAAFANTPDYLTEGAGTPVVKRALPKAPTEQDVERFVSVSVGEAAEEDAEEPESAPIGRIVSMAVNKASQSVDVTVERLPVKPQKIPPVSVAALEGLKPVRHQPLATHKQPEHTNKHPDAPAGDLTPLQQRVLAQLCDMAVTRDVRATDVANRMNYMSAGQKTSVYQTLNMLEQGGWVHCTRFGQRHAEWRPLFTTDKRQYSRAQTQVVDGVRVTQCPPRFAEGYGFDRKGGIA